PVPQSKILFMLARATIFVLAAALGLVPASASAQTPAAQESAAALPPIPFCGQQAAAPRAEPPAGSPPVVLALGPCFEAQGGTSVIEPQTYLYYIQVKQSRPSEGVWMPYDATTEKTIEDDFHRLWNTNFLDNLF